MAQLKSEINDLYEDIEENFEGLNTSKCASSEDLNLFDDFIISKENEKKLKKEQNLKEQFAKTEAEMQNLQQKCHKLEEDNKTLIWNIASLWKTSIAQLRQKDTKIRNLQKENEALIFKRAMRQISRDELNRIVSHIAAYHKDEFAEFMESLRSQALMQTSRGGKQVSSYQRAPYKTSSEIHEIVVGSRIMKKENTSAMHLQSLMSLRLTKNDDLKEHSQSFIKEEPRTTPGVNDHMKKPVSKIKSEDFDKTKALLTEIKCGRGRLSAAVPIEPQTIDNQQLDQMMKTKCEDNYNLYSLVNSQECPPPRDGGSSKNMIFSLLFGQNRRNAANEGTSACTPELGAKMMSQDPHLPKLLPCNTSQEFSIDGVSTSGNFNQKGFQDGLSNTQTHGDNLKTLNECSGKEDERKKDLQKFAPNVLNMNELGKSENLKIINSGENSITNYHSFQNPCAALLYSPPNHEDCKNKFNYSQNDMEEKVNPTENSRRPQTSWKDSNKGTNQLANESDKHVSQVKSNPDDVDQASESLDKGQVLHRQDADIKSNQSIEKSSKQTSPPSFIADHIDCPTEQSNKQTTHSRSNDENVDRSKENTDKKSHHSRSDLIEGSDKQTSQPRSNHNDINGSTKKSGKQSTQSKSNADSINRSRKDSNKQTSRSRSNADNRNRSTENSGKQSSKSRSNTDSYNRSRKESNKRTSRSRSNANDVNQSTEKSMKKSCRSKGNNVNEPIDGSDKRTSQSRNIQKSDKQASRSLNNENNQSTEKSKKRTGQYRNTADGFDCSLENSKGVNQSRGNNNMNSNWSMEDSTKRIHLSRGKADGVEGSTESSGKRANHSRRDTDRTSNQSTEESDKQMIKSKNNTCSNLSTEDSNKGMIPNDVSDKQMIKSKSNANSNLSTKDSNKRMISSRTKANNVNQYTESGDKEVAHSRWDADRNSDWSTKESDKRITRSRSKADDVEQPTEECHKHPSPSRSQVDNVDQSTESLGKVTQLRRDTNENSTWPMKESNEQICLSRGNVDKGDCVPDISNKGASQSGKDTHINSDWSTEECNKRKTQSKSNTIRNSDQLTEESDKRTFCCSSYTDKVTSPKYTKNPTSTIDENENKNEHKYKDKIRSSDRSDKEKTYSCKSKARRERDVSLPETDDRTVKQLHVKSTSSFPCKRTAQDIFSDFVPESQSVAHCPLDIHSWKIPKKNLGTIRESKAKWHATRRGKSPPSNYIQERKFNSDRWKVRYRRSFNIKYGRINDYRRVLPRNYRHWASRQLSPQRKKRSERNNFHDACKSPYVSDCTFKRIPPCKALRETRSHGLTSRENQDVNKQRPSQRDHQRTDVKSLIPEPGASSAHSHGGHYPRDTKKRECELKDEKREAKENKTNLNIPMAELEEGELVDDSRLSFDLSNEQDPVFPQNPLTKARKILKETIAVDNCPIKDTPSESNAEISSKEKLSTEETCLNEYPRESPKPLEPILDNVQSDKKYLEMEPNHSLSVPSSSTLNSLQKRYSIHDNVTDETFDGFIRRYQKNNQESISLQNDDSEMSLLQFISPELENKCSLNTNLSIAVSPQPFHTHSHSPNKFALSPCSQKNLSSPVSKKRLPAELSVSEDKEVAAERLGCNKKLLDIKLKCTTPDKPSIVGCQIQDASPICSSVSKSEHILPTSTSSHFQYSLSGFHIQETPSKMSSPFCSPISLATPLDTAKDLTDSHTPPPLSSTLKISTPVIALNLDREPRFPMRVASASIERVAFERSERRGNLSSTKEEILKEDDESAFKKDPVSFSAELRDEGKTRERLGNAKNPCIDQVEKGKENILVSEFDDTLKKVGALNPPKKRVPFYTISREVSRGENSFCQGDHYKDFGFASSFYKTLDKFEESWPKQTKYIPSNCRLEAHPTTPTPSHQQPISSSYETSPHAFSHSNNNNNTADSSTSSSSSSNSSNISSDSSSSCCSSCTENSFQTPTESLDVGSDLLTSFTTPLSDPPKTCTAVTESDDETSLADNCITSRSLSKGSPNIRHKVNRNDSTELKKNCNKSPSKVHKNGSPKPKASKRRRIQPIPVTEETHNSSILFTLPTLSPEKTSPSTGLNQGNLVSCPLPSLSPGKSLPSMVQANQISCPSDEGFRGTKSLSQETASVTKTMPEKKNKLDTIPSMQMVPPSIKIPAEFTTSTLFGNIEDLSNSQLSMSRLFGDRESNIEMLQVCTKSSLSTPGQNMPSGHHKEPGTPVLPQLLLSENHLSSQVRSSASSLSTAMSSLPSSPNDTVRCDPLAPFPTTHALKLTKIIKVVTPNSVILRQARKRTRNALTASTTTSVFSVVYRDDKNQNEKNASSLSPGESRLPFSPLSSKLPSKDENTIVQNLSASLPQKRTLEDSDDGQSLNDRNKGLEAKSDSTNRALQENTTALFNPRQVFRRPIRRRNQNLTPTKRNYVPKR